MTGFRYFVGLRAGAVIAFISCTWSSFAVGGFINRFGSDRPSSLIELANAQLSGLIPATVVGAAGTAFLTARMLEGSGRERWTCASLTPGVLTRSFVMSATLPVLTGWLIFWVSSTLRFVQDTAGLLFALGALVVSCAVLPVGVILGGLVGSHLRRLVAVPAAIVASYGVILVFAIVGDEAWWSGLSPGLGPYLDDRSSALWFPGEIAWHLGVALLLGVLFVRVTSSPRRWSSRGAVAGGVVAVVGVLALAVAGVS